MNNVGLNYLQARNVLTEAVPGNSWEWNDPDTDTSIIERYKKRNFIVAVVTGVVATVAIVALYIFALVVLVIQPNPSNENQNNPKGIGGLMGAIFGSLFGLPLGGFGLFAGIGEGLDRWTVEPFRKIKKEMAEQPANANLREEDLIWLMQNCDYAARKALMDDMNFEQLKITRSLLWKHTFKSLIQNVNKPDHSRWRDITSFEEAPIQTKINVIRNGAFHDYLKIMPKVVDAVKELDYAGREKALVINELNKLRAGYNDEDEKVNFAKEYPRSWLLSKCEWAKQSPHDMIDRWNALSDDAKADLIECLDILKGDRDLPSTAVELERLRVCAIHYGMNQLLELVAFQIIEKGILRNEQLFHWIAYYIPQIPEFNGVIQKAAAKSGIYSVNSPAVYKMLRGIELWKEKRDHYFNRLLKNPCDFRIAYQIAQDLQDDRLRIKCEDHLNRQDDNYKRGVYNLYGLLENIPRGIYSRVQNSVINQIIR
jgi:hypothetical protein